MKGGGGGEALVIIHSGVFFFLNDELQVKKHLFRAESLNPPQAAPEQGWWEISPASLPGKPDLLISICIIMQLRSQPKPAVQTKKQAAS